MHRRVVLLCLLAAAGCNHGSAPAQDGGEPGPDLSVDLLGHDLSVIPSGIGDPCSGGGNDQGTCNDGQLCIPDGQFGFAGGYCTQDCAGTLCADDSVCVPLGAIARCFVECTAANQCRTPDYACQNATSGHRACLPVSNGNSLRPGTRDGGACVTPVQEPGSDGGIFSANVQVSPGASSFDAEGELAVDPTNRNVVIAYNKIFTTFSGIGVVRSTDDGKTWANELVLPPDQQVDKLRNQSDPVVAVDTRGDFFVSWVGFNRSNTGQPTNMNVFVARSSNGGITLDQVVQVSPDNDAGVNGQIDKPWIFASPLDDSLWVTWDRITQNAVDIRLSRSLDGGRTWTAPVNVNDAGKRVGTDRNLAQTCIPSDGQPAIAWVEIGNAQFGSTTNAVYLMRYGPDGTPITPNNVKVTTPPDSPAFEDPSVAVSGGNVYVGFISGTSSGAWDVRVAASLDGGATFRPSVKANDDPTCATHFHHQIAVDARGNVHAVFFDNRYLAGNVFWAMAGPADEHNDLLFGRNQLVNDVGFTFTTRRDMSNWLGDYLGLWIQGGEMYVTWTDNRTTNRSHMFFTKARVPQ